MGFVCVFAVVKIYALLHPNYPTHVAVMSKAMHISAREALELDSIHKTVSDGKAPTESEWASVRKLFDGNDREQERYGLLILCLLHKTKYREQAIQIASGHLDSADRFVKAGAMTALAKLHDPRWKQIAIENENSSDPFIKKSAIALLERQDRFK